MKNEDGYTFKDALDSGKELDKGIKFIIRIHKLGFAFFRYSLTTIPLRLRILNWVLFSWAFYNLIITFSKFPDGYQNAGAGDTNWFNIIISLSAIIGNCTFEITDKKPTVILSIIDKLSDMDNLSDIFNIIPAAVFWGIVGMISLVSELMFLYPFEYNFSSSMTTGIFLGIGMMIISILAILLIVFVWMILLFIGFTILGLAIGSVIGLKKLAVKDHGNKIENEQSNNNEEK